MTDAEWLACVDPSPMLEFLKGTASDRKIRLFICACCRRIWHLLTDERSRHAVEVGECFADGLASEEDRSNAEGGATGASGEAWTCVPGVSTPLTQDSCGEDMYPAEYYPSLLRAAATQTANSAACDFNSRPWDKFRAIHEASRTCRSAAGTITLTRPKWAEDKKVGRHYSVEEFRLQSTLIHDVFGNPFQAVTADCKWLTSTVVALAEGIYQDRAFDRMPILADALQDAGCDNDDILAHCRDEGQAHVRGCWVVDLVRSVD